VEDENAKKGNLRRTSADSTIFSTSEHLVKQIADEFSDEKFTHRKKKQKMLLL
jgi:hypothetical protein